MIHSFRTKHLMRLILPVSFCSLILLSCSSNTEEVILTYPTGEISQRHTEVNGKREPEFLRTYTKGILDGYLRKWAPDGTIIYEAKYSNDTLVEVKGEPIKRDTTIHQ